MKKYYLEEDVYDLVEEESFKIPKEQFDTEQEFEVRIPFTGYYSLKIKCKDAQYAMLEVLRANNIVGITSLEKTETFIEHVEEDETICFTLDE